MNFFQEHEPLNKKYLSALILEKLLYLKLLISPLEKEGFFITDFWNH